MRLVGGLLLLVALPGVCILAARGDAPEEPVSTAPAHASPWALVAAADGKMLYAACGPLRGVACIDVPGRQTVSWIRVEGTARGLALSPDGGTLAVSLERRDEVLFIDTTSQQTQRRMPVGGSPEGLAFSADGQRLFVANRLSGDVSILDLVAGEETVRVEAGREPFAVVRSPDGRTTAVVSRRANLAPPTEVPVTEITLLDGATGAVEARVELRSCHLCEAGAFTPDSRHFLVPAIRVRNLLPIVQVARGWVLSSVLAVVDVASGQATLLPLQYADAGFADPAGVIVSPDGTRAYVASGGSDEVAVLDLPRALQQVAEVSEESAASSFPVERFARTSTYVLRRAGVGDNPRGLAWLGLGAAGDVAVSDRLDDALTLLDREGRLVAHIPVGPRLLDDAIQRGRRAFFDASYCFQNMFSCTSCHPEGHTDGLTYDFDIDGVGRNVVLNRSLLGMAGTAPFKWTGINPSLQRQCGARFAMVLTRADVFPAEALDDMAAFLLSRPPPRSRFDPDTADEALRASIERGRRIFGRSRRKDGTRMRPSERCITCHRPPLYSNNQLTEVGTRTPIDDHDVYDTPHLTGGSRKAPYLHDGRVLSLEALFTTAGLGDRHGFVSDLTPDEIRDLVAFLESL